MKTFLIVDDEAPAHSVLKNFIQQYDNSIHVESAFDGLSALRVINNNTRRIDALFLDIDMPRMSGLEILNNLPYTIPTIITTAYTQFAFDAYQGDAVDYLLKPISLGRFVKAMSKISGSSDVLDSEPDQISVRIKDENLKLEVLSILFIEGCGNYIKIHLENSSPIVYHSTLKAFHEVLGKKKFIRVSKSHIINTRYVSSINDREVVINRKIKVGVGRQYKVLLDELKNSL